MINAVKGAAVLAATTKVDPEGYGGWNGDCPGCDRDLLAVSGAVVRRHSFFYSSSALLNGRATWPKFSEAIRLSAECLTAGDLLFIYRSGHGGQTPDLNGDEPDGMDETLCMYDRQVADDELWALLCGCVPEGVRVLLVTDACHSGTSFRAPPARRQPPEPGVFRGSLLALSGCADDKVSWGDARGGKFTRAFLAELKPGRTYAEWIAAFTARMGKGQVPRMVEAGPSFLDKPVLT